MSLLDIDECSEGTSGCSQLCTNTISSYTCTCDNGYQLTNDNHTCTDIDECTLNNNGECEQDCINTIGSYQCQCREGFQFSSNGRNCTGNFKRLLFLCIYYNLQILMSVLIKMEVVNRFALIL